MAPRFSVTVARRCDPRVKALRGEVRKRFDRVVEDSGIKDARLAVSGCAPTRARITEYASDASTATGGCTWSSETTMTSSSHGSAGTARTRMFMPRERETFLVSAASVVLATLSPSAVMTWTIRRPPRIWSVSSIRYVPGASSVGPTALPLAEIDFRSHQPRTPADPVAGYHHIRTPLLPYPTHRASTTSSRYFPVLRNARSRRPSRQRPDLGDRLVGRARLGRINLLVLGRVNALGGEGVRLTV